MTQEKRVPKYNNLMSPLPTEETQFAKELKEHNDEFNGSFDLDLTNHDIPFTTTLPDNLLTDLEEEEENLPDGELLGNKIRQGISSSNNKLSDISASRD